MSSRGEKGNLTQVVPSGLLRYRRKVSVHFGVANYLHWATLKNGASDARTLAERFQHALDFDQSEVILDEAVTKTRIEQVFMDLAACHADDLIVVTWSGHGHPLRLANGEDTGFLVPYGAPLPITRGNAMQFVGMKELGRWANDGIETRHVVFLLDCCFSGLMSSRGGGSMSDGLKRMVSKHLGMRCRYVINAGTKDEEVSGDGAGAHSPFVTAILQSKVGTGDDQQCDVEDLEGRAAPSRRHERGAPEPDGGHTRRRRGRRGVSCAPLGEQGRADRIHTPAAASSAAVAGEGRVALDRSPLPELSVRRCSPGRQEKAEQVAAQKKARRAALDDAKTSGFEVGTPVKILIDERQEGPSAVPWSRPRRGHGGKTRRCWDSKLLAKKRAEEREQQRQARVAKAKAELLRRAAARDAREERERADTEAVDSSKRSAGGDRQRGEKARA